MKNPRCSGFPKFLQFFPQPNPNIWWKKTLLHGNTATKTFFGLAAGHTRLWRKYTSSSGSRTVLVSILRSCGVILTLLFELERGSGRAIWLANWTIESGVLGHWLPPQLSRIAFTDKAGGLVKFHPFNLDLFWFTRHSCGFRLLNRHTGSYCVI